MTATELERPPKWLLTDLAKTARPGTPLAISADGLRTAKAWLQLILTDYRALRSHLECLASLYRTQIYVPTSWEGLHHWPDELRQEQFTRFPLAEPLGDEFTLHVANHGLQACNENQIGRLLLNPEGLLDLFDLVDESSPPAWMTESHQEPKTSAESAEYPAALRPASLHTPSSKRWIAFVGTIAAGILIMLTVQLWTMNKVEKRLAQLETKPGSGGSNGAIVALHHGIAWQVSMAELTAIINTTAGDAEWKLQQILLASDDESLDDYIKNMQQRGLNTGEILAVLKLMVARHAEDTAAIDKAIQTNEGLTAIVEKLREKGLSNMEIRAILLDQPRKLRNE